MQAISDRTKRIFLYALSFWPAEMRHQNRLRAVFAQVVDGWQACPNARIIGDLDFAPALLGRHIEIDPHKDTLAANIEVSESEFHVRRRNGVLERWRGVTEFITPLVHGRISFPQHFQQFHATIAVAPL